MAWDPGFVAQPGGGVQLPSLGGLLQTGINLGTEFLQSRFAQVPSTQESGMPAEMLEQLPDAGTISVNVLDQAQGCGCNGRPKPPEFVTYAGDPCYPRQTTRTFINSAGCKVTIPVWAPPRKKPRINPYNMRAAGRAARRLSSLASGVKRQRKAVAKAARELS